MKNKTVTLDWELVERVADEANHMLGFTYAANYDTCRAAVDELRAALAEPVPHAGEEVEVLGYQVTRITPTGNARLDRPLLSKVLDGWEPAFKVVELVDRAHVTRLQAEVERLSATNIQLAGATYTLAAERDALQSELTKALEDLSTANDKLRRQDIASQYKDGQISKHEGELAMLQAELTKARERVYELEHAIFHALDDSIEYEALINEVAITKLDFEKLNALLPEDWEQRQSAPAAKDENKS